MLLQCVECNAYMLCLFNLHTDLALVQIWYQGSVISFANVSGNFFQIRCDAPPFLETAPAVI